MNCKMKERLKWIASIYLVPMIFMAISPLMSNAKLNDEAMGTIGLMVSGFLFGLMLEGLFLMLAVTLAILLGKMDDKS
jgi:hypothetical protein